MATALDGFRSGRDKKRLTQYAADRLRDLIFERGPGERIGSLTELAEILEVGIVTVQQAARVLEHEGLLQVRRGPNGGYYGARPDAAALVRSIEAYIRMHPEGYGEALEIVTLLFCELAAAAAANLIDDGQRRQLRDLSARIDDCDDEDARGPFETELQDLLFKIVDRPIFELLTRVALQLYAHSPTQPFFAGTEGVELWKQGRRRVMGAILAGDVELARFEAQRNRQVLLARSADRTGQGAA